MPAGVSWGQYLRFTTAAMVTAVIGSQVVHQYYRPMLDLNEYINKELRNFPENIQVDIRNELIKEGVLTK